MDLKHQQLAERKWQIYYLQLGQDIDGNDDDHDGIVRKCRDIPG